MNMVFGVWKAPTGKGRCRRLWNTATGFHRCIRPSQHQGFCGWEHFESSA